MRVFHVAIGQRGDVDEAILVHADVDKGPEGGDVGDHAFEQHAGLEVGERLHAFLEGGGGEFGARVTAGFFQFAQDVADGRQAEAVIRVLAGFDGLELAGLGSKRFQVQLQVGEDAFGHRVGLGVNGGGIKRVVAVHDAQKAGCLLERLLAQARHVAQLRAGGKAAACVALRDDGLRHAAGQARHARQQRHRRGVDVDTDGVDAVFHHGIERTRQLEFADVVLVLADTDGLGVDFHQFGERVLQAARNGDRAAQRNIELGQFARGELRCGVDRCAGFGDDDAGEAQFGMPLDEVAREAVGLARGRAVADGDERHPMPRRQLAEHMQRAVPVVSRLVRVDRGGIDDLAGGVDDGDLHAGAYPGVESHGCARACGRGQQQIAQVAREHLDGFGFGAGAQRGHEFRFQMHADFHAPGEAHGIHQPAVSGTALVGNAETCGNARLAGVVRIAPGGLRGFAVEAQAHVEQFLAPAAKCRERAMRGHGGQLFGVVEIVGIFFCAGFLASDDIGLHHTMVLQIFAQALQQGRVFGKAFHQDLACAVERCLGVGYAGVFAVGRAEGLAQVACGLGLRYQHRVGQQRIGQGVQPGFARNLRARATFGFVRQVEVFKLRLVRREQHGLAQFGCELVLFLDGLEDGRAARFEFTQVAQSFLQQAQLHVVEATGGLLAIARDEGHRCAFVEEGDGGSNLGRFGRNFGGEAMFDGGEHGMTGDRKTGQAGIRTGRCAAAPGCRRVRAECRQRRGVIRARGFRCRG